MIRLGDVATYINGYAFKPEDRGVSGLPIIRIQDLTGNSYDIGYYDGAYPAKIEINNGDILISWSASLGIYVWNRGKALLNQHIFKVVFDKIEINRSYFVYAIRYKLEEMGLKSHGATMKHIIKKDFDETKIPYLSLEMQQDIVARLDLVSNIANLRKKELNNLDLIIKARFVELFGDPLKNDKGLPTVSGKALFKLSNGKALPNSKRYTEGIPAYGGNGISWYTDEILCDYDTIIVGRVGFQSGNVHLAKAPLWITDNAMYISSINSNECDIRFLCALMEHLDFTRYQDAGDLKKITQKPFMQMHYLMPPISSQREYIAFVAQVNKSKVAVQKALDEAQTLFDSLMQEYFG